MISDEGKMRYRQLRPLMVCAGALNLVIGFLFIAPLTSGTALAKRHTTPSPTPSPTWQLMDYDQKGCVNIANPYSDRTTYYGVWIKGRWTRSINAGISNGPMNSTSWSSYTPIPPGSSDGIYSLASVALKV